MSAYDRWLEAPFQRMCAEADAEVAAWEAFCDWQNGPEITTVDTILGPRPAPPRVPVVPYEACEEDHVDHAIFVAWEALMIAVQDRENRLEAEFYDEMYSEGIDTVAESTVSNGPNDL